MSSTLWASRADLRRIARARGAVLMIGSYDGSGNYGDVLQFSAARRTVERVPSAPLAIAVVERAHRAHHALLLGRYPDLFGDVAFAYFQAGEGRFEDELAVLPEGIGPARAAIYAYGGGYLNQWWGARKVALVEAAERLAGAPPLPLVASGLQVEEDSVAPGGVAHELLSRASWVGLRDTRSLRYVRTHVPSLDGDRTELVGDDATPHLNPEPGEMGAVVNLHFNEGDWVSDDPQAMIDRVLDLLLSLARAARTPLRLQPLVAYEDPYTSEGRAVSAFLARHGGELEAAGFQLSGPVDVLADAAGDELVRLRCARLTVCCSYHVAMSSMLAGIPTVMLAENEYYAQKAAGLRDLFGLDPGMVGVRGSEVDPGQVAEVLANGPRRAALVERLRDHATGLCDRQARGREATAATLGAVLAPAAIPGQVRRATIRLRMAARTLRAPRPVA